MKLRPPAQFRVDLRRSVLFLMRGDVVKVIALAFITVFSSFLELVGMGLLIPIVVLKFIPGQNGLSGGLDRVAGMLGLEQSEHLVTYLLCGFVGVLVLRSLFQVLYTYVRGKLIGRWRMKAESAVLRSQLLSRIEKTDAASRLQLQAKINIASQFVEKSIASMFELLASTLIILFFLVVLVIFKIEIAIAAFCALMVLTLIRVGLMRFTKNIDDHLDFNVAVRQKNILDDTINLMKEIQIYRKERYFYTKFDYVNRQAITLMKKERTLATMPAALTNTIFISTIAAVYLLMPENGEIFNGQAIALTIFVSLRLMPRISKVQQYLLSIQKGNKGANVLSSAVITLNKVLQNNQRQPVPVTESLRLERVCYSLGRSDKGRVATPVLTGVDVEIRPGSFVGIVGPSGAGKTTLLGIIAGLRWPTTGSIIVDGVALTPTQIPWMGPGYLSQNPATVAGGLVANVAFGQKKADFDKRRVRRALADVGLADLWERAKAASEDDDLMDQLSAGERQRLGLARALYSAEDLLVLDEPTSNLDAETEARIMKEVHKRRGSLTIVLAAHRIHTLRGCDMVLHVERGHVRRLDSSEAVDLLSATS